MNFKAKILYSFIILPLDRQEYPDQMTSFYIFDKVGFFLTYTFPLSYDYFYSDIPDGQCAWIGASTWNVPDYELRWLQLPISYHSPLDEMGKVSKQLSITLNQVMIKEHNKKIFVIATL